MTSLPSDIDEAALCYLCLDGGLDDADQPLRRDCSCRGTDAGYVHLSCLTGYAEIKSEEARTMREIRDPWQTCPHCHQDYQNELAIDIATKFVSFVRGKYPDNTQRQVESLQLKLCAFDSILDMLKPVQKREAGVTANVLLSLIQRMKGDVSSLPMRYSQFQAFAYNVHGRIALNERTEESARRAVVHFKKDLSVCEAIGEVEGIAVAKGSIAVAQTMLVGDNTDEYLKASKELYELRVAKHGEAHEITILAGKHYAGGLQSANRGDEARELLTKLLATSKQVLGPHHNTTKGIEAKLKLVVLGLC